MSTSEVSTVREINPMYYINSNCVIVCSCCSFFSSFIIIRFFFSTVVVVVKISFCFWMVRQMSLQNMQTSSMKYKRTNQNERGKEKESTEKNFNVVTNEKKRNLEKYYYGV